jgi:cytoplasmic iron level regulating protein YaaA (DUF328/UPF0246 family)
MKIVLSPAKSLDFESPLPADYYTSPCFLKEAEQLNHLLKKQSPRKLARLMGISPKLAALNWQRNQEFTIPFNPQNARPALYAFNGDVYEGLDAYTLPVNKLDLLQNNLRILSGLYGILKPLDLIQPYRLEMGTPLKIGKKKNLYAFWKSIITKKLNDELQENELFLNLASDEYFYVIDAENLKTPIIKPHFKEFKDGTLKTISFFAKKARGLMVRYIIDTQVKTLNDIQQFHYEDYRFSEAHTLHQHEPVFIR